MHENGKSWGGRAVAGEFFSFCSLLVCWEGRDQVESCKACVSECVIRLSRGPLKILIVESFEVGKVLATKPVGNKSLKGVG